MGVVSGLGQSHPMQLGTGRGEEKKGKKDEERETKKVRRGDSDGKEKAPGEKKRKVSRGHPRTQISELWRPANLKFPPSQAS